MRKASIAGVAAAYVQRGASTRAAWSRYAGAASPVGSPRNSVISEICPISMSRSRGPWRMSSSAIRSCGAARGGELEVPVEPVVEGILPCRRSCTRTPRLSGSVIGVFHVDHQRLVTRASPARARAATRPGKLSASKSTCERAATMSRLMPYAHDPVELDASSENRRAPETARCGADRRAPS